MLADDALGAAEATHGDGASTLRRSRVSPVLFARLVTTLGAAGIVVAYALPGGAYDLVIRQEYGLVIWVVIAIGYGLGLLPSRRPPRVALAVLGALVTYTAWVGLSFAWTESAERTATELARALDYVGLCLLIGSVVDRRLWRAAATGVALGAMVICALAVGSRLFPPAFPANTVGAVFHTNRLSYPFGYWNAVAAWGAMSIAIGLSWGANDGSGVRRALMAAGVPLAGTMTYLSYSRAGAAAAVVGVVAVLALSRQRWTALILSALAGFGTALVIAMIRRHPQIANGTGSHGAGSVLAVLVFACAVCGVTAWLCPAIGVDSWRLSRQPARVVQTAAVVVAVCLAGAFGPHLISRAWHQFRNTTPPAASSDPTRRLTTLSGTRYNLWVVAADALEARPLTGTGAGTYGLWWNRHERDSESVKNAHSIWLETGAELGIPGLLAMIAVLGGALGLSMMVRARSGRRTSAAASTASAAALVVFVLLASVDWMWQSTAIIVLALAGVAAAACRLSQRRVRLPLWARVGVALLAAAAAAFQIPGLLSTLEIRRSQSAERHGNGSLALAWARAAVDAEPWSASPYDQLGLVEESAGNLSSAASDLKHAVDKESTNYTHWVILSRIDTEQGRLGKAAREYEHAHSLLRMGQLFETRPSGPHSAVQAPGG